MNCKICLRPEKCDCLCSTCVAMRDMLTGKTEQLKQFAIANKIPYIIIRKDGE